MEARGGETKLDLMLRFSDVGHTGLKAIFPVTLTNLQSAFNIELLFLLIWRLYGFILAPKQMWLLDKIYGIYLFLYSF